MRQAESWQDKASNAWSQVDADLNAAATWEVWEIPGDLAAAGKETLVAQYYEARAGAAFQTWAVDEMTAFSLQLDSDLATAASQLAAYSAEESEIASRDEADAESLAEAYA